MSNFKQTQQQTAAERLSNKFRPKTYYESMRAMYHAVLGASFFFNLLSAVTASALIYFFMVQVLPMIAALVFTALLLLMLEAVKRMLASRLFMAQVMGKSIDVWAGLVVCILSAASIASSFKGAERIVLEYTPPAPNVDRTELDKLNGQLKSLDDQIKAQQANVWKGQLTYQAARTIDKLTKQKGTTLDAYLAESAKVRETSAEVQAAHKAATVSNAGIFALFTLACELLFFLAAYWLEYYDYRSYVELSAGGAGADQTGAPILALSMDRQAKAPARTIQGPGRTCLHCSAAYEARHAKQKYCTDKCRLNAWHAANGRPVSRNAAG